MKYRFIAEHKLLFILFAIASIVLVRTLFADSPNPRNIVGVMVDKEKVAIPNELDEALKDELPIASFVLAQNTICYSCTLADGTAVKCHSSSTYYRRYPCSSTDTSSTHHRGTCPIPDAC